MVRMTGRRSGLTDAIWQIPCPLRRSKTVTKYKYQANKYSHNQYKYEKATKLSKVFPK